MKPGSDNRKDRASSLSRSSSSSSSSSSSFLRFYVKYRELILFNRNIIIAAISSIIVDAIVVNYAVQITSNSIVVSLVSMITDSAVYLATFAVMFLIDNKTKYIDSTTGKKDSARFRRDVKKIITALGVSELVYMFVKFTSVYILLQSNLAPPYQVAVGSTLLAWIVYIITANAMVKWQKLFK